MWIVSATAAEPMTRKPQTRSIERGWDPPPHVIQHLDKIIIHNREHPECRLGAIKVAAWLARNGFTVSKDAVYRWLKKRSRVV